MTVTENITVLFTDVVGSTELASRLPPDAVDDLRRKHFSVLRQAVAETGGREVKNLGDGLMVVFSTASGGLACAVAMQQGVERDNRAAAERVEIRIGLSGGEVTRDGDDYFGDPVIEASRLCAHADGGQILVSALVGATAGRRNPHALDSVGGLPLKGLPEPVETLAVRWEPLAAGAATGALPLPIRLELRPQVGIVGRDPELAILAAAYKRVAVGDGREVVLLRGEPGTGKTTVAAEAAHASLEHGACVLLGRADEELSSPYQLFAEALGHYVTHAPEARLALHVAVHGSELAPMVPALHRRFPGLETTSAIDTDTERYLLFEATVGLLSLVSQDQTLVIVLEDLQWADNGSLQLLRHVVASDHSMRVLIIGTYRDSELSQTHPFLATLAALRREAGVARIELTGLDDAGVVSFMEAAAGHHLDEVGVSLAHSVYRETDGNPFFVGEVLRNLVETGTISKTTPAGGRRVREWSRSPSPTASARSSEARVARLGKRAQSALSMAAVIGRDFDLEVLAAAEATEEDDLLEVLDTAGSAALVRELSETPGHYSFAHALIQHTLYDDLGPTRRARAHRRVAEALEDLSLTHTEARTGELAYHWFNATQPVDVVKALQYSRRAAEDALARAGARRGAALLLAGTGPLWSNFRSRSVDGHRPTHRARNVSTPGGRRVVSGDAS